jgi:hypothetical protein
METIEIIVYTAIALIVVSMGLSFILGLDAKQYYDDFSKTFGNKQELEYKKVSPQSFVKELYLVWDKCGKGEIELSQSVYVVEDDTTDEITKEFIFDQLKKINYCSQLQSEEFECGSSEDLTIDDDFNLPAVIKISCSEDGLELTN